MAGRRKERWPRRQSPAARATAVSMFRPFAQVNNYVAVLHFDASERFNGSGNEVDDGTGVDVRKSESPKRAADVTAGAVPAASPQTSAHASDFRAFDETIHDRVVSIFSGGQLVLRSNDPWDRQRSPLVRQMI